MIYTKIPRKLKKKIKRGITKDLFFPFTPYFLRIANYNSIKRSSIYGWDFDSL